MDLSIVHRLGIALALGLVVGIERGWQARESTEGLRNIGARTFGLVGLLGGIAGVLPRRLESQSWSRFSWVSV